MSEQEQVGYFPGIHVADALADHANASVREITATCQKCSRSESVKVMAERHDKYMRGGLVQDVFPDLTVDEREVLMNADPPWAPRKPFIWFRCSKCWED